MTDVTELELAYQLTLGLLRVVARKDADPDCYFIIVELDSTVVHATYIKGKDKMQLLVDCLFTIYSNKLQSYMP